jgi:cytochrome c oxidase cbb3-type subunit 1
MLIPYFLMLLLYLFVAVLAALDASLISFELLPWFNGVRWLRIHFITLGMLTQVIFGALPVLVATRRKLPWPSTRWDIWLTLNVGLIILLAGIPSVNQILIFTGGTLIFIAATLLAHQLWRMRSGDAHPLGQSVKFYVTGLLYLLLGIIVGTGLWLGWSGPLRIQVPLEVHIHANNWGFLSLVFAGLIIDMVPMLSGQSLATPRTLTTIFWSMTLGALGLVLGPWLGGALWVTVPGLVLHIAATVWMLGLLVRGLARAGALRSAGAWHLVTAYVWILLPVLIAPFILLNVPGFVGGDIEATAPQALIYGWVLQFAFALIPFLVQRYLLRESKAGLGGNWLSLFAVNVGSALVWASIFVVPLRSDLHSAAYVVYVISMLPVAWQLGRMLHDWFKTMEQGSFAPAGD